MIRMDMALESCAGRMLECSSLITRTMSLPRHSCSVSSQYSGVSIHGALSGRETNALPYSERV